MTLFICCCVFSEGRRFISEDRKEGDVYDTLHLGKNHTRTCDGFVAEFTLTFPPETRSQNTEKLGVEQAASILLNFLQQAREMGESGTHTPDEHHRGVLHYLPIVPHTFTFLRHSKPLCFYC